METLVAAGLMALLLSGVAMVLAVGSRYGAEAQTASDTQQQAGRFMDRLLLEMSNASAAHVLTGSESVSGTTYSFDLFLSPDPNADTPSAGYHYENTSGKLLFQKWVCYFADGSTGKLWRSERALDNPDQSDPSDPSTLQVDGHDVVNVDPFFNSAQLQKRADSVTLFQVGSGSQPRLYTVNVRIQEQAGVASAAGDAARVWTRGLQTAVLVQN